MFKKNLILLVLFFSPLLARADYITTNYFEIDNDTTVEIVISGNLTSNINAETGVLSSGLSINFNITTNEALTDIRLKATTKDDTATDICAFSCTGSSATSSQSMHLVFASEDHPPTALSIADCKCASSTPENNPDSIAYPGTVSIDGTGLVCFDSNGYFTCEIPTGETNLNMSINTTPKSGTYDAQTSLDEPDVYKVEIYLDNIPS